MENIKSTLAKAKSSGIEGTAIIDVETVESTEDNDYVELILENIVVTDINIFKHNDIREYIHFYTISRKSDRKFDIYLKGITNQNETCKKFELIETRKFDDRINEIKGECGVSYFDQTGEGFGDKKNQLECLKEEYKKIMGEELNFQVLHFCKARDAKKTFFPLKDLASIQTEEDFFGINISINGIIVKERIPMKNIGGGGNGAVQYYAVFETNKLGHTIDRNGINANENNSDFLRIVKNTMKLIDTIVQQKENVSNKIIKKEIINIGDSKTIQGLFGELVCINNDSNLIKDWAPIFRSNNDRKPVDFEGKEKFVETKTKLLTGSMQDDIIHINSVDQLDQSCEVELRVFYLKRYQNSASKGQTILELISDVSDELPEEEVDELFVGIGNYLNISDFKIEDDRIMNQIKNGLANEKLLDRFEVIREDIYTINKDYIVTKEMEKDGFQSYINGYDLDLKKVRDAKYEFSSVSYEDS